MRWRRLHRVACESEAAEESALTAEIPLAPEALTLSWLNSVLLEHGIPPASDVSISPFGESGVYGSHARIDLNYASDRPDLSLVAKFALADESARMAVAEMGAYGREYCFYTSELASLSPIPVPRCYFAHFDAATQESCLLIELIDGMAGDDVAGATREQALLVCRAAGRMHAFWEGHPALERNDWLEPFASGRFVDGTVAATEAAAEEGCRALAGFAPDWLLARGAEAGAVIGRQLRALGELPETLVHVDYRLPNFIFQAADGFTLIDWQFPLKGPGVVDLGMFLFSSLTVAHRRAWQDELVAAYAESGSVDDAQAFDRGLQRLALFLAFNTIRNAPLIDLSVPGMPEFWKALTERAYAAVEDLGARALL
jgi:hypothetical protein